MAFGMVAHGERSWHLPGLDCHITLCYADLPEAEMERRLDLLQERVRRVRQREWVGAGVFHEALAQDHYAWMDLLVATPIHQCLSRLAHEFSTDTRGNPCWRKRVAFHASFRTRQEA